MPGEVALASAHNCVREGCGGDVACAPLPAASDLLCFACIVASVFCLQLGRECVDSGEQDKAYGGCRLRTHSFRDQQLGRADEAGSWQIADRGATRKAAAGGTSVGYLRLHFVAEL